MTAGPSSWTPLEYRCTLCGLTLVSEPVPYWWHQRVVTGPFGHELRERCHGEFRPVRDDTQETER